MYKSPITIESLHSRLVEEINEDTGERVYSAVLQQDISVDRDELFRALQYDRGQYDAGYRDGIAAAEKKLVRCCECKHGEFEEENKMWACVRCADYDEDFDMFTGFIEYHEEAHFCSYGERRDDDAAD